MKFTDKVLALVNYLKCSKRLPNNVKTKVFLRDVVSASEDFAGVFNKVFFLAVKSCGKHLCVWARVIRITAPTAQRQSEILVSALVTCVYTSLLTARLWMSLYEIILKFFLHSGFLFLFPTKLSSTLNVTASVPERNCHFIANPLTAQRERGWMKEGKKKAKGET